MHIYIACRCRWAMDIESQIKDFLRPISSEVSTEWNIVCIIICESIKHCVMYVPHLCNKG